MNESNGVRWTHYEDVPDGDRVDNFSHWKDLGEDIGAQTVGTTYLYIEPGERGPMHAHDDPIEDVYFVLEGTLDIETPEDSITVEAGTIVYFEPGVAHRPANNSDDPATVLTFRARAEDGSVNFRSAE